MVIKHNFASESMLCWAAIVDFWQARLPQWQPHHRCAAATPTTFYFTKFRQDRGFAGLTSRVGPEMCDVKEVVLENTTLHKVKSRCAALW